MAFLPMPQRHRPTLRALLQRAHSVFCLMKGPTSTVGSPIDSFVRAESVLEHALTFIALLMNQIASALASVLVAAFLNPALFGVVNLSRTLVTFGSVLCSLGLDLGLQKQLSGSGSAHKKIAVVKAVRALAFGISLVVLLVSWMGGANFLEDQVFRHRKFAQALLITVLALPFLTDLSVLGGAYRGFYRPLPSIIAQSLVQPLVRVFTIVVCLASGQDFLALPLGIVTGSLLSWATLEYQAGRFFGVSANLLAIPLSDVREVLSFSAPLGLAVMISMVTRMLDLIFIGYFRTPNELGEYSVILLLTQLIGLAGAALTQTLGTRVAAAYGEGNLDQVRRIQIINMKQVAVVSAPFLACVIFWGDRVDLLVGQSYALDWRVLTVAGCSAVLLGVTHGLGHTLGMSGYQKQELGIIVAGFIVQSIGCWFLVPWGGQMGAATASLATVLFIWLARVWTIKRFFGIVPVTVSAFYPLIGACVLASGIYHAFALLFDRGLLSTAVACFLVFLLYGAIATIFAGTMSE
jgi:O-antigen/teichoic acid export membrane protein